ncbi:MAG: sensor histidine kinase [Thermodesulfobacteriota bacterium]
MDTFFAPAARVSPEELAQDLTRISNHPVVDGLMATVGGLLAVLNSSRQILAVNDTLLASLGIANPQATLGLRPGELLHCSHSTEAPNGCGTTRHCATCGAAIAIVSSLSSNKPMEKKCIIRTMQGGTETDICFRVRCAPMTIEGQRYLLLFLQDITTQEKRAALERAFFHDINNLLSGLQGACELLLLKQPMENQRMLALMKQQINRLLNEVTVQRSLLHAELGEQRPAPQPVVAGEVLAELKGLFANHSAAKDRILRLEGLDSDKTVLTEPSLLIRVLSNMLTNACEASAPGDTVRLWVEEPAGHLCFAVWNRQEIDESVRLRIFQRYITTKEGVGRGTGTYAMKLFGETFLNGQVSFSSSASEGTVFRICLPA